MSYPPSSFKTWTSGEILTASDLNNSFTTVNNSNQTEDIDDYSTNATEMRVTTDPYPSGSESLPSNLAGELERIRYLIKQITGKSQWYVDAAAIGSKGADVASAAALPVLTDGNFFDVTGTTTITSINSLGVGSVIYLQFDGALTLTHHSTDLILPGAANITTAAGHVATFFEYASGDWICIAYNRPVGPMIQDIGAAGFKLTGLGAGSAAGHSVRYEQMKILQVVMGTETTAFSTSNAAFQITSLNATITPVSTSNKVLVFISGALRTSNTSTLADLSIYRGSTNLGDTDGFVTTNSDSDMTVPAAICYLDSPSTTSATTYAVRIKSNGGASVTFGAGTRTQVMILMEVNGI